MQPDSLAKKAAQLRKEGRVEEAVISAQQAVKNDPSNSNAYWQLALCQLDLNELPQARQSLVKVTELTPRFAAGWTLLGLALQDLGEDEGVRESFEKAVDLDQEEITALEKLVEIYRLKALPVEEMRALHMIERQCGLNDGQLNRLGILHHNNKEFYAAITYYRKAAAKSGQAYGLFNAGLVFSDPEVRQYADAIDSWRRALRRDPAHEKSLAELTRVLPIVTNLRDKALGECESLLQEDQWYGEYTNPFSLLAIQPESDLADIDAKTVSRARKALLQEIELEDGVLAWLPGSKIDRSRALAICDELDSERLRQFHHTVYRNQDLREFLQRGFLQHFLVGEAETSEDMSNLIDSGSSEFIRWLSPTFAAQFNIVFTKALAGQNLDLVRCMLSGRRFVLPEDEDKCFDGAHRLIDRLLAPLREAASKAEREKPQIADLQALLNAGHLSELISTLPIAFHGEQQEAASLLRSISVDTHNYHSDTELAKKILAFCDGIARHSPSLKEKLKEDAAELERQIAALREREVRLNFGKKSFSITYQGVIFGEQTIDIGDLKTIRFGKQGIRVGGSSGTRFLFAAGGKQGPEIVASWDATDDDEPSAKHWSKIVDASLSILIPKVVESIRGDIDAGRPYRIGETMLTKEGIEFTVSHWFSTKKVICPWPRVKTDIGNGVISVFDSSNRSCTTNFVLHEVKNAVVLPWLTKAN